MNTAGDIVQEVMAVSEPDAIVAVLHGLKLQSPYVGLETGLLSKWIFEDLDKASFQVMVLRERIVDETVSGATNMTSRQSAYNIAKDLYEHVFVFIY